MNFTVSRDGTTLVTLHEGTDTTACAAATTELRTALESLDGAEALSHWTVDDAEVYEPPNAPFDPYTITVAFTVTVTVDAADVEAAKAIGATAIEEALESADIDAISYSSAPVPSAA